MLIVDDGHWQGIIINELGNEIAIQRSAPYRQCIARFTQLEGLIKSAQRSILRELGDVVELDDTDTRNNESGMLHSNHGGNTITSHQSLHHHRDQMRRWRNERRDISIQLKNIFNPHFGSMFRTMINPSMFADKIRAYGDL